MVLFLFFCSGAAALIYEVTWSKYLGQMFGSTVQAQTVVLAVFMGGLALGNKWIGKRADFLHRPLVTYGYIEIAIGLYAFFFEWFYALANTVFIKAGAPILDRTVLLLALKGVLSIALLLLPTILMGGTLPLLAAWLQKNTSDAGRRSARFYSINSLGAVCGSFIGGFILIQWIGLHASVQLTALINIVIGILAVLIGRTALPASQAEPATPQTAVIDPRTRKILTRGCILVTLTGAISMGMEILAARGLSLIFGASVQAFAVVLISFILGIGLGSAVVASQRWRHLQSEKTIVVLLLLAAAWISLFIINIEGAVDAYRHLKSGVARSTMGYRFQLILSAVISLVVLGVPAALLGSVLPICIRALSAQAVPLGGQVGRLLTWNTFGAVAGVLLTGFVLMPALGLRGALGALAGVLGLGALILALSQKRMAMGALAAVAMVSATAAGFFGGEGWRYVLSSGVFRNREIEVRPNALRDRRLSSEILFYEDAPDATVSVEQELFGDKEIYLRINGKVDASSKGDISTQYLCAHLPMLMRPDSKNVFVLGFGSGITAGALLGHPVEKITVAENCAPVLRAGQDFAPWNAGILTNSRARILSEDARTILKLSPEKYDIIINEPSNPRTAGIGSVFSREFYEIVKSRLNDDGIVCQWFHVYEMHDGIVFLVLRTFASVFPDFEIWDTNSGDILLVGGKKPFRSDVEQFRQVFARPMPRSQLEAIGLGTPEALLARQMSSQRSAFAIPGPGPMQTDGFPILEYEAPKAFFLGQTARQLFQFDERTWQMETAPPGKTAVLKALEENKLRAAFTNYPSANSNLRDNLSARFNDPKFKLTVPCIFQTALGTPQPDPAAATNELARLLREAGQAGAGDPEMEKLRNALQSKETDPTSRVARVGAISRAIKTCLQNNDVPGAKRLLDVAKTTSFESWELDFLGRIAARE